MRELTLTELDQVGGAGWSDALQYLGTAAAIGQVTYGSTWGTIAVMSAFGTPLAALTMVGLAFGAGYAFMSD
jgi:hypothetical protein